MQTFLPYEDFWESMRCLDDARLSKQRVEAWQALVTLLGRPTGHERAPAVRMWRGFELSLLEYGTTACLEWRSRGNEDGVLLLLAEALAGMGDEACREYGDGRHPRPNWLGRKDLHASHRAALLAKDPAWYKKFRWEEQPMVQYVWPV